MPADQWWALLCRTGVLAAKPYGTLAIDHQMTDRQAIPLSRQKNLFQQFAANYIYIGKRRLHGVGVQLQLAVIWMCEDAAIGHTQCAAVWHEHDFVGPDTMREEFTHTPVVAATAGVVHAQHAMPGFIIVFCCDHEVAVG